MMVEKRKVGSTHGTKGQTTPKSTCSGYFRDVSPAHLARGHIEGPGPQVHPLAVIDEGQQQDNARALRRPDAAKAEDDQPLVGGHDLECQILDQGRRKTLGPAVAGTAGNGPPHGHHPTPHLLSSLTFKANHPEMGKVTTISKKTKEVMIPWQIQDSQPWEESAGRVKGGYTFSKPPCPAWELSSKPLPPCTQGSHQHGGAPSQRDTPQRKW